MRSVMTALAMLTVILGAAACGGGYSEQVDAEAGAHGEAHTDAHAADAMAHLPDEVKHAVMIAKAIESDPDQAEEVLAMHNMTEESFEQLMYDIAADPELSKAYQAALGN